MKSTEESAEDRIRKIIGTQTFDLCYQIYKKISSIDEEPLPKAPKEYRKIKGAVEDSLRKGIITQEEARSWLDRLFRKFAFGSGYKHLSTFLRQVVKKKMTKSGSPTYAINFLILVLADEMRSATGRPHYKLIQSYFKEKGIVHAGENVKFQYGEWKDRRAEILKLLNWVISVDISLLTHDVLALRDRHFPEK